MGNTEVFDAIAAAYDTPERVLVARIIAEAFREAMGTQPVGTAVDFGCGTGLVGLELMDRVQRMVFVDTSQNMLARVAEKMAGSGMAHGETRWVDFEEETLTALQADCILVAQVLLHIRDIRPVLTRLLGVLNPGGQLLIADFDLNAAVVSDKVHSGFDQQALGALLADIGYADIGSRTFYSAPKLFMGQEASLFVMSARKPRASAL